MDNDIINLFWNRAEGAIDALSRAYGKRLYQNALNLLGNPQDAEECLDDTYLAVWNSIPPHKPISLCAFVIRVGRYTALNRLRANQAQKRNSSLDVSLDELAEYLGTSGPEDQLQARQLGQAINRFLATVQPENRAMFLRRYWFGDSVKDIAAAFSVSENVVSVRLNRIRHKLKLYLIKEGLIDAT